jgi:CBS domain-containing protein
MRPVAITLRYRVSIATAAAVLTCEKVSSILVVDDRGALCGVLTVEDLAH